MTGADPTPAPLHAVILAAGKGTRLGRPLPKPLTELRDGRSILRQQVDNLRAGLGTRPGGGPDVGASDPAAGAAGALAVTVVVGFKAPIVMEAVPDVLFAYNPDYDTTNTARSLHRALSVSPAGGVLWLNGDVVFDPALLGALAGPLAEQRSFVCVNTAAVGDEEVKYTVDATGHVAQLSKTVRGGLGEAVGINFVAARDRPTLLAALAACSDEDYFERGLEDAVATAGLRLLPVDISAFVAVEVDFEEDLARADALLARG